MRTTATFDHGKKAWCVQVVELGPSPILLYCDSRHRAIQVSDAINSGIMHHLEGCYLDTRHSSVKSDANIYKELSEPWHKVIEMTPVTPNAITYDQGWDILNEVQRVVSLLRG